MTNTKIKSTVPTIQISFVMFHISYSSLCSRWFTIHTNGYIIIVFIVQVKILTIAPSGTNNVVSVVSGESQTFTCTTDTSRPATSIQWYIGEQNVTDQATPQPPTPDGTNFISSSTLVYTGDDTDHNKAVYCEAVNIEGRQPVRSTQKILYIKGKTYTSIYIYILIMEWIW